jgi:hypothetical protein
MTKPDPDGTRQGQVTGGGFMVGIRFHGTGAPPGARLVAATIAMLLVAACAAPGTESTPSAATTSAPATVAPPDASALPSASAAAAGPDCGTEPVELNAYFETGFDLPFRLSEEFKGSSRTSPGTSARTSSPT